MIIKKIIQSFDINKKLFILIILILINSNSEDNKKIINNYLVKNFISENKI